MLRLIVVVLASAVWLKGNLHTHTLESDGDSTPAEMAAWYRDHGYDFLAITDHDKLTKIDAPQGLVLIPAEEVTDRLNGKSLHVNAIGIQRVVAIQGGKTKVDVLQRDIDAVRAAGGIALVNHPNFGWAFGADELLQLENFTLLEIASGHPYVNMYGPPSEEAIWDRLLTAGRRVWGVGVDDSHHLKRPWDTDVALPGKAWVVVHAERDAKSIVAALQRGEFYASTGVELEEISATAVKVKQKNGAHYRIQFIGSGGRVLQETEGLTATCKLRGDEAYVRVKVIDSNGRMAWGQPQFVKKDTIAR
ncbi:MAG TPA: CehA/McbA family metallohydrolase [Thermoanaerobaculia bacterium]|nr:CehA/McbA family metallohydrolase [Thermoanaerobaculia bacterium]